MTDYFFREFFFFLTATHTLSQAKQFLICKYYFCGFAHNQPPQAFGNLMLCGPTITATVEDVLGVFHGAGSCSVQRCHQNISDFLND